MLRIITVASREAIIIDFSKCDSLKVETLITRVAQQLAQTIISK